MATSQNGYSANDRSVIATYTVPGTTLKIALRKGDVSVVLLEYLRRYHLEVESLYHVPQDLWGYAERTIRGSSTTLSNHASGTAVDARAVKNGLGMTRTFTATQEAALNSLIAWFEGVLRHGKDYSGRKDPMHAEINKGASEVARIANKIRGKASVPAAPQQPKSTPMEDDLTPDQARMLQVVYDQITGNNFKGWTTWPGGSRRADGQPDSFSLVDYGRKQNQRAEDTVRALEALDRRLAAIEAARTQAPAASNVTASQVVDELLRRLKEAS